MLNFYELFEVGVWDCLGSEGCSVVGLEGEQCHSWMCQSVAATEQFLSLTFIFTCKKASREG